MRRMWSGESGAVLVIVMAFVGVIGALALIMIGPTLASAKRAAVTAAMVERSVTVESALEAAIADVERSPAACGTVDPPTLNDLDPTVTCSATDGGGAPLGSFALVADEVHRDGTGPLKVVGSVLDRSGRWSDWGAPGAETVVEGGDLVGTDGTCEPVLEEGSVVHAAPGWVRCVDAALVHEPTLPPSPEPSEEVDPDEPPADIQDPEGEPVPDPAEPDAVVCRIFRPGTYQAAPKVDVDVRFLPGTYTFDDIGDWSIRGDVVVDAGAAVPTMPGDPDDPEASEVPATRASACPAVEPQPGVVWRLTGDSSLTVEGPAALLVGGAVVARGAEVSFADPDSTIRLAQLWAGSLTVGADLAVITHPARTLHLEAALPRRAGVRCVAATADIERVDDGPPLVTSFTSNLPDGVDPPTCDAPPPG